jgi:type II secretory pathway component GspD/PulD (secretin)
LGGTGIQIRNNDGFGSIKHRLPFTLGTGGWEDEIVAATRADRDEGVPTDANISNDTGDNPISFGTLDFSQTQIIVKLLKTDTKTKIVQAPKIITLDHHESTIFVGDTVAFAKAEIIVNDNGTTSVQLVEGDGSPVRTGFQILLLPHIIPETNKVQLTLIPSNDALSGQGQNIAGFNTFAVAGQEIDLPQLTSQVVVTHMILESGQTAVVGGLMSVNQTETISKVPFLGDMPLIGYFFKEKGINKRKEDLFIFVTPRIVQSAEDTQEKLKAALSGYRKEEERGYSVIWGGGKNEVKENKIE